MIAAALRFLARGLVVVAAVPTADAQAPLGYDPLGVALAEAEAALGGGAADAAVAAARRALELAPGDRQAFTVLLGALNAAGEARAVVAAVEPLAEGSRSHRIWFELGRAERGLGRPARARRAFERALEGYPSNGPARAALVELAYEAGELERAAEELGTLLDQAPEFAWARAFEGRLLVARGEREAALASLRAALPDDDERGSVRFALIEACLDADPRAARELAEPWLDEPPGQAAFLLAGRAALAAGDPLAAVEVGLAALRREPGSGAALQLATEALDDAGAIAERLLERRLAVEPRDAAARAALARRILDAGEFERALAVVDDSRASGDGALAGEGALAGDGARAGDGALAGEGTLAGDGTPAVDGAVVADGALEAVGPAPRPAGTSAAAAVPGPDERPDPTLELLAVEALRRSGRADRARARLDRLLVRDDAPPRAHYEDGWLRFGAGELEAAAAAFERAAAAPELRPLARYNRGVVLERAGLHAPAAEAYRAAVAADPSLAAAWLQLGGLYQYRLGERARAAEAYRRHLELVGEDAEVRARLEEVAR